MHTSLQLEVVTPDRQVVSESVEYVSCPGIEGELGILPNHASLLSALKIGAMHYTVNGQTQYIFISGGFADVNDGVLSVLAEAAEHAADIDQARALAAKERAERRLANRDENVDVARAEAALQRALVRLNLVSMR